MFKRQHSITRNTTKTNRQTQNKTTMQTHTQQKLCGVDPPPRPDICSTNYENDQKMVAAKAGTM